MSAAVPYRGAKLRHFGWASPPALTSSSLAGLRPPLAATGMVLNKDGSFQRTAQFRGSDLDSAVPAEPVAVAGRLNNAFRRLGSSWGIFVKAQRHAASTSPASTFYVSASSLGDAEHKADFEKAGSISSPATS